MFAETSQVLSLYNHTALVFVGLGLCSAMLTHRKLATWYMAETPPTRQNTSHPHAAGRCVHSPTGIADVWCTAAVGQMNEGLVQCKRPGVLLRHELCAS